MICTKCNNDGVFVQFQTFSYWYCRNCKIEIELVKATEEPSSYINHTDGSITIPDLSDQADDKPVDDGPMLYDSDDYFDWSTDLKMGLIPIKKVSYNEIKKLYENSN